MNLCVDRSVVWLELCQDYGPGLGFHGARFRHPKSFYCWPSQDDFLLRILIILFVPFSLVYCSVMLTYVLTLFGTFFGAVFFGWDLS